MFVYLYVLIQACVCVNLCAQLYARIVVNYTINQLRTLYSTFINKKVLHKQVFHLKNVFYILHLLHDFYTS